MGGKGSGSKKRALQAGSAAEILNQTAAEAAKYLQGITTGHQKRGKALRVAVCQYIIDQAIGKPTGRRAYAETGAEDYEKLENLAKAAIDLALSRGAKSPDVIDQATAIAAEADTSDPLALVPSEPAEPSIT